MNRKFIYKILIFDDDPLYAQTLKDEIMNTYCNEEYDIIIEVASDSRVALESARNHIFDVFVLDVCDSKCKTKSVRNLYGYGGRELYINLIDEYDFLKNKAKFFVISNLYENITKEFFEHAPASYICKRNHTPIGIASIVVNYLEGIYDNEKREFNRISKKRIIDANERYILEHKMSVLMQVAENDANINNGVKVREIFDLLKRELQSRSPNKVRIDGFIKEIGSLVGDDNFLAILDNINPFIEI